MDPYGDHHRKILSPLDKIQVEQVEIPNGRTLEVETLHSENSNEDTADSIKGTGLVDHLTDLRRQLIKSIGLFSLFFVIVFSTISYWFPFVTRGHSLIILGPLEVVKFYMSVSTALALGFALPFLSHFLWQFVKPGLNERESRFIILYFPFMFLLFLSGVGFGYFVVNPLSYNFLVSIGAINFNVMVSAQEYVSFLLMTTIPLGFLFELPVVALFLATIELLTSDSLKKIRKWSYVSLAVISALITPPDFISQLIVLIPMIILYEISVYVVLFTERRREFQLEK